MHRPRRIITNLLLLLAVGCGEPRAGREPGGTPAIVPGATVRIVFPLAGDDIGSPESTAALDRVTAAVAGRGAGEVLGSGFGMGRMELVVRVGPGGSRALLEEAVGSAWPSGRFRVEAAAP